MIHRFQHIYAWFLYGLMTIVWLGFKDFQRLYTYQKNGLMKAQHGNSIREWTILIITKITFILYAVIIPILVTSWLWWQVLIGVFILHYIAGFILAIIFQPAHVIEGTAYPLPDDTHTLEDNWVIHQLKTTTNFSNNSVWFSWYVGGLNFQIEHHLFPSICHVHYKSISRIVRSTAEEFNLPYKTSTTFFAALRSHSRLLKTLGKKPSTSFHPQATI
jgi:linoleoyl-CoA desaturase